MKIKATIYCYLIIFSVFMSSCASIFGGKITSCQRTPPAEGEPPRKIRPVPLVLDLFVWPSLVVDFSTGAIYKPCEYKFK